MAETETVFNRLETKLESIVDGKNRNHRLKRVIGIILSAAMIGLSAYAFKLLHQNNKILSQSTNLSLKAHVFAASNYRSYVHKSKELKLQLDETTHKLQEVNLELNQVTAELNVTRSLLVQTRGMLVQTQDENNKFKKELQALDGLRTSEGVFNVGQLQTKIDAIKLRDSQISSQLSDLKSKLRTFEADFSNLAEGRALIVLFRNKIRYVKSRMHYLKQEASKARIEAQKERDRLAILNGNNGFIIRGGQLQSPKASNKSFMIDVKVV